MIGVMGFWGIICENGSSKLCCRKAQIQHEQTKPNTFNCGADIDWRHGIRHEPTQSRDQRLRARPGVKVHGDRGQPAVAALFA